MRHKQQYFDILQLVGILLFCADFFGRKLSKLRKNLILVYDSERVAVHPGHARRILIFCSLDLRNLRNLRPIIPTSNKTTPIENITLLSNTSNKHPGESLIMNSPQVAEE